MRGDYGPVLGPSLASNDTMRAWGSRYARLVFERCGRNKRQACRVLNISYHTLQAYLRYADRAARMSLQQLPGWVTSMSDPDSDDPTAGS